MSVSTCDLPVTVMTHRPKKPAPKPISFKPFEPITSHPFSDFFKLGEWIYKQSLPKAVSLDSFCVDAAEESNCYGTALSYFLTQGRTSLFLNINPGELRGLPALTDTSSLQKNIVSDLFHLGYTTITQKIFDFSSPEIGSMAFKSFKRHCAHSKAPSLALFEFDSALPTYSTPFACHDRTYQVYDSLDDRFSRLAHFQGDYHVGFVDPTSHCLMDKFVGGSEATSVPLYRLPKRHTVITPSTYFLSLGPDCEEMQTCLTFSKIHLFS